MVNIKRQRDEYRGTLRRIAEMSSDKIARDQALAALGELVGPSIEPTSGGPSKKENP